MALILKHQTEADFLGRLRSRYLQSQGEDTINLAAYVVAAQARGDWSDAQMRAAFGRNVSQWAVLKNKMISIVNARAAVRGAVGE